MTFVEMERILKKNGWYYYSSVGAHIQYKHKTKPRKNYYTKAQRRNKENKCNFYFETSRNRLKKRAKEIKIYIIQGGANMKLIYPACFFLEEDGAYSVTVPDLLGCFTQGNNIEEAVQMAQDAALGWLLTASEENEELPKASNIQDIKLEAMNSFTSLLLLDFRAYLQKYGNKKVVKKTITIPEWINTKAKQNQINFSQTLQDALLYKIANKME